MEAFLEQYGLAAAFVVMMGKFVGVPIPVPADVIMLGVGVRIAQGRLELWQAFVVILLAMVLGGLIQFILLRGPGHNLLYRYGRYLGLTAARLDSASATVRRGGPIGIGLAILTPGVRSVTIAACGLAGLPLRTFVLGLVLGCALFLSLHLLLGYAGKSLVTEVRDLLTLPVLVALVIALLVAGLALWVVIRRRQRPDATRSEVAAEALEAWHEATCPVCLVLGTTSRLHRSIQQGLDRS